MDSVDNPEGADVSILDFITGKELYCLPAPGGSVFDGKPTTNHGADGYLAAIAGTIKQKDLAGSSAIEFLIRRRTIIENQRHFGAATDNLMIARLNTWIKELAS